MAVLLAAPVLFAGEPKPAPELKFPLTSGEEFDLAKLRGKVVAVEFIFTTCSHCQHLTQTTGKLLREFGPRGFRPVAAAFNENAQMLAPEFVKQYDIAFPVGISTVDQFFAFSGMPQRRFRLPALLFIDRKGMIRAQYTGEDSFFNDEEGNMRKMLEQLLAEPAPAKTGAHRSK